MPCRSTLHRAARAGTLVPVLLGLLASSAWGYRPFVSTDAAVVERARMEIELGYLTLVRTAGENTFVVPQVVLNYGLTPTLELVGEFSGCSPHKPSHIMPTSDGIFLTFSTLRQFCSRDYMSLARGEHVRQLDPDRLQ